MFWKTKPDPEVLKAIELADNLITRIELDLSDTSRPSMATGAYSVSTDFNRHMFAWLDFRKKHKPTSNKVQR